MLKTINLYLKCVILAFISFACTNSLLYTSVKKESVCSKKNGYWYQGRCWKDFEDEGISADKIDSVVYAQMELIEDSKVRIADQTLPLVGFMPLEQEDGLMLLVVYGNSDLKTLLFQIEKKDLKKKRYPSKVIQFEGSLLAEEYDEESALFGTALIQPVNLDQMKLKISGKITNKDSTTTHFELNTNEAIMGAGTSRLKIEEKQAYLSGDLGTITYAQIKNLIEEHPSVKTLVLTNVSGSLNDAVNMHTGRLLRTHGLTTKVLSDSDIASGGVDLFCAGEKRIVEKGAKIGVHSWCCVNDMTAIELPKDHPAHQYQLEYFTMVLGKDMGPNFYFYTLQAAPFDGVHYMSDEEIKSWKVATEFISKE